LCDTGVSATGWSNAGPATTCPGGYCSNGQCGFCFIDGGTFEGDASNPANPCQVCGPATDPSGWTNVANGTVCPQGFCNAGSCGTYCFIDAGLYAPDASNGGDICQVCAPASNPKGWTNLPGGTPCGPGSLCSQGTCLGDFCTIDGGMYDAGVASPTSECNVCQPSVNGKAWTLLANGTACAGVAGATCGGGQGNDDGGVCACWNGWPTADAGACAVCYNYVVNGAVVTDLASGLIWQKAAAESDAGAYVTLTQAEGQSYCQASRVGGYADWRLPTLSELESIVDMCNVSTPVIYLNPVFESPLYDTWYWTGDPDVTAGGGWLVQFDSYETYFHQGTSFAAYVRCVR
jgi:hypothetical protein